MTSSKRLFSGINITCARGGRMLFRNLSFAVNPGEVIQLSGANGSGKTSLLRIMCGALPITSGIVTWDDKNFLENGADEHARRISFLPSDDRSLKVAETVFENLRFWSKILGRSKAECFEALEKMNIVNLKDIPVRYLSAGQKRRVSLARMFLKKAPLWLLDEPLNGLDRDAYDLFEQEVNAHCASGGMTVIASHQEIETPKDGSLRKLSISS